MELRPNLKDWYESGAQALPGLRSSLELMPFLFRKK